MSTKTAHKVVKEAGVAEVREETKDKEILLPPPPPTTTGNHDDSTNRDSSSCGGQRVQLLFASSSFLLGLLLLLLGVLSWLPKTAMVLPSTSVPMYRPYGDDTEYNKGIFNNLVVVDHVVPIGASLEISGERQGKALSSISSTTSHHHHHMILLRVPVASPEGSLKAADTTTRLSSPSLLLSHVRSQRVVMMEEVLPTTPTSSEVENESDPALLSYHRSHRTHSDIPVECSALEVLHLGVNPLRREPPPTTTTTTTTPPPPPPFSLGGDTPGGEGDAVWTGITHYLRTINTSTSTTVHHHQHQLNNKRGGGGGLHHGDNNYHRHHNKRAVMMEGIIANSGCRKDEEEVGRMHSSGDVDTTSTTTVYGSVSEDAVVRAYVDYALTRYTFLAQGENGVSGSGVATASSSVSLASKQLQQHSSKLQRDKDGMLVSTPVTMEFIGVVRRLVREYGAVLTTTIPLFRVSSSEAARHALTFYDDDNTNSNQKKKGTAAPQQEDEHHHHDHPREVRPFVDLHLVIPGHVDTLFIVGPTSSSSPTHNPRLHSTYRISDGVGSFANNPSLTSLKDEVSSSQPESTKRNPFMPAARADIAVDAHTNNTTAESSTSSSYSANRRTTAEEMADRSISVTIQQQIAPGKQTRSITFVSGGYTSDQKAQFSSDVSAAMSILRTRSTSTGGVLVGNNYASSPWDRYFPLLNIYSVFEPSVDSGASRPHGAGYSCPSTMSDCGPTTVNNNLECAFGTPQPSRLACSYELAKSLASFAPVMDIIVVLVNDNDYGGTGSLNFASLTNNADNLPFLLLHEIGHAVGNLGDEYSYGYADPVGGNTYNLPNCATTSDPALVQWSEYITAGLVDATPSSGCSYDNYWRPTDESKCIMRDATAEGMCGVCKDAMTTQLFGGNDAVPRASALASVTDVYVDMTAPHCPHPALQIYLSSTETTTLTLNHRYLLFNTNVTVRWGLPDGSTLEGSPSATVFGSTLTQRTTFVTATITDSSDLVRRGSSGSRPATMTQTITYTIILRTSVDTCDSSYTCSASTGAVYSYCGVCTATATSADRGDCSQNSTIVSLYDAVIVSDLTEEDAQKALIAAVVVMVVIAVIVLILAVVVSCVRARNNPQPVYEESTCNKTTWLFALITSFLVIVAIILLVAFFVGYIGQLTLFGAGLFSALLAMAVIAYIVALLLFASTAFRLSILSIIASIVMILFAIIIFCLSVATLHFVVNRNEEDVVELFAEQWEKNARDNPDTICTLQSFLGCSGYYYGCIPTANSYCPSNCDIGNRDPDACLPEWQEFAWEHVLPASIVGVLVGFGMLVAAVCGIAYCALSRKEAESAAGRRSYRKDPRAPVKPLTTAELASLKREFKKADADGTGELEGEEVLMFINSVFPEDKVAMAEAQDFMDRNDPMSFEDVVDTYFPFLRGGAAAGGGGGDPRLLTTREAERADDPVELQRLQFEKLDAFTNAAGRLSPEALNGIFQSFLQNNAQDARKHNNSPTTRKKRIEDKKKARIQNTKELKRSGGSKRGGGFHTPSSNRSGSRSGTGGEDLGSVGGDFSDIDDEDDENADQELFNAVPSAENSTARGGVGSSLSAADTQDLLRIVRKAAQEYGATEPSRMLDGLTLHELEGLRGAWVSLRPLVRGHLADREIDQLYQWTHGAPLNSHEHFVRWKEILDVRGTGKIYWEEFCVPFAQRARLKAAKSLLKTYGKEVVLNNNDDDDDGYEYDVPPYHDEDPHVVSSGMRSGGVGGLNYSPHSPANPHFDSIVTPGRFTPSSRRRKVNNNNNQNGGVTRRQVLENYDAELVAAVFVPFEEMVPAERVAAAWLARGGGGGGGGVASSSSKRSSRSASRNTNRQ